MGFGATEGLANLEGPVQTPDGMALGLNSKVALSLDQYLALTNPKKA